VSDELVKKARETRSIYDAAVSRLTKDPENGKLLQEVRRAKDESDRAERAAYPRGGETLASRELVNVDGGLVGDGGTVPT
jgi:hypothetical protein